jgi:hypothetical protein
MCHVECVQIANILRVGQPQAPTTSINHKLHPAKTMQGTLKPGSEKSPVYGVEKVGMLHSVGFGSLIVGNFGK